MRSKFNLQHDRRRLSREIDDFDGRLDDGNVRRGSGIQRLQQFVQVHGFQQQVQIERFQLDLARPNIGVLCETLPIVEALLTVVTLVRYQLVVADVFVRIVVFVEGRSWPLGGVTFVASTDGIAPTG